MYWTSTRPFSQDLNGLQSRLPRHRRTMASFRALQSYGKPVLLRLVDGPQPQHKLSAPAYALEALREVGLVKKRMVAKGCIAEAYWFLADEEGPTPPKR